MDTKFRKLLFSKKKNCEICNKLCHNWLFNSGLSTDKNWMCKECVKEKKSQKKVKGDVVQKLIGKIDYPKIGVDRNDETLFVSDLVCSNCSHNTKTYEIGSDNLCFICFKEKYGKIELFTKFLQYHGGHKAFLAGGMFEKYESGTGLLTKNFLIFQKFDKNPIKQIKIVIPLKDVILDKWSIEEKSRRTSVSGMGGAISTDVGLIGGGGGVLHEEGKSHRVVLSYVDENGVLQEPRFGISSFGGKVIRLWASKIYEFVIQSKNNLKKEYEINNSKNILPYNSNDEDPIKILKVRYAKGEITKEEFDKMKEDLK